VPILGTTAFVQLNVCIT